MAHLKYTSLIIVEVGVFRANESDLFEVDPGEPDDADDDDDATKSSALFCDSNA